jgi:hypothetical protein
MNPIDKIIAGRLDRLLEAARAACPPASQPSPWFEQRMLTILRSEPPSLFALFDGVLVLRMFVLAGVVTLACAALPLIETKNPYAEALALTDSAVQLNQSR